MSSNRKPVGLDAAGKKLWSAVDSDFELAEHELAQLEEACRIRDTIVKLRGQVSADGLMIGSSQGSRLHPGVVEIRQQQLALARILATLKVPGLEEDGASSTRGVRGVYAGRA